MEAQIYVTARIRKSPFFERTLAAGATQVSVYNKTYLVGGYAGMESEFWSLVRDVTLWDVTCQRVVEIAGPDAFAFTDLLTPRDLSRCRVGQCRYVLITNRDGGILNDPVLMRLAEDRFWLSRADSDILMWAQGVAVHAGMEVSIGEPDTATLQLQGPKSVDVLTALIDDDIAKLRYYHHRTVEIAGIPLIVARTGWSAEHGYELYLQDLGRGPELWDLLMEAGRPCNIAPAAPNRIRRIEAGIFDYGVDLDDTTSPYEAGLDRLVQLGTPRDFIGKAALARIRAEGIRRKLVGLEIEGPPVAVNERPCPAIRGGETIGKMTSWVYSPRLERNIGLATLAVEHSSLGTGVVVRSDLGDRQARVVATPFLDPNRQLSRS
jgi:aminomethyltransferase